MSVAVQQAARRPAQQPEDDETVDVTVQKLRLVGALKKAGINVDVTQVLTDGQLEDSTTGAPQLTLHLLDRDYGLLQSGVFGQKVDVALDGIPFRVVEVNLTDVETVEILLEHKLVNVLRQFKSPMKASRATVTRAQFIERLLHEAVSTFGPIRYVCPEINVAQPVAGSGKVAGRSLTSKTLGSTVVHHVRGSGFGLSSLSIQYWSGGTVTLGPTQLSNAATVLQLCKQLNAPSKAVEAVCAACIVEPTKPFENTRGGGGGSNGILQWIGKSWSGDVVQSVLHALQDPGATGRGGMITLANQNPSWTPGQIAQAEQGSAFPTRYDQAVPGARQVISAFTGAGGFTATGITFGAAGPAQYEFSRGQPGQVEDSWTCMQRLAREVNWRVFVAGRNALYFVTDDDLLRSETKYLLGPTSRGVERLTFQVEVGGRTVRRHHHRQPKPSEMQLAARMDRWAAPPGTVLALEDYGVGDGRWIVIDTVRALFDREGTVSLQSPQAPFPEPAAASASGGGAAQSSVGGALSGTAVDKVYQASQQMDGMNLPYSKLYRTLSAQPPRGGYDCSAAVSWVLLKAGFPLPNGVTWGGWAPVSGDFSSWGQPGPGAQMTVWYTVGHIFIEFIGRAAKRFDTVPGGSGGSGPHLRYTAPGSPGDTWEATGFAARHFPGT